VGEGPDRWTPPVCDSGPRDLLVSEKDEGRALALRCWAGLAAGWRSAAGLVWQRAGRAPELDEEESATHSPLNYGEAAIVLPGTGGNEDQVSRFFQTLYEGLAKDQRAWMPYEDPETRFPLPFHPFDNALNKDHNLMMAIITPRAIPVNFFGSGKASNLTYEFYNPSALARQLAFGQLPIALCYADVVKPRETITSGIEWIRIAQLPPNVDLSAWIPALFITQAYKQWWEEWKEHLFCRSALTYRGMIDPKYKIPENTVSFQPMLQSSYITFTFIGTYFLFL